MTKSKAEERSTPLGENQEKSKTSTGARASNQIAPDWLLLTAEEEAALRAEWLRELDIVQLPYTGDSTSDHWYHAGLACLGAQVLCAAIGLFA